MKDKMKELSNVEIALLQIISEKKNISGYDINRIVEERGYREWSGIGTTSIYVGLQKLLKKGLLSSKIFTEKKGKGPLPYKYNLTTKGAKEFKEELLIILSSCRERDARFDLGLAAIASITKNEAGKSLEKRKAFLESEHVRLGEKFSAQSKEKLPFHVKALFRHPLDLIKAEIKFTEYLLTEYK